MCIRDRYRNGMKSVDNMKKLLHHVAANFEMCIRDSIYIVSDHAQPPMAKHRRRRGRTQERFSAADTLKTLAVLALCTAVGYGFIHLGCVSYTHLDVYKRQVPDPRLGPGEKERPRQLLGRPHALHAVHPVSYTHLSSRRLEKSYTQIWPGCFNSAI